jgi:NADH-quinone oxidoreductase subunit E
MVTSETYRATPEETAANTRETRALVSGFSRQRSSLIPLLQAVQAKLGYVPGEAMTEVAAHLDIPAVAVYEVVTFYNQFRRNPPGEHSVRVCLGTACHMKGGHIALDAWQRRLGISSGDTTADKRFDLDEVACVGCCSMAPVTVVDDNPEAKCDPTRVDGILLGFEQAREKEKGKGKKQADE